MPDRYGPYRNSRYLLEIGGITRAGFSEATIPSNTTEATEYREGNAKPTVQKLWSLNSYENLTLQWGTTDDSIELFEWRQQVEEGDVDGARQNIAIEIIDEEGEPGGPRWEFEQAWPVNYDAPDFNATESAVAIESLEIAHEGMKRVR